MNGYFRRMHKWLVLCFGCLLLVQGAQAASFDCAKAGTKVEKMICADAELSKLDDELNVAYKAALQDEKQADAIKQAQKQWMKERINCSDVNCVKRAYKNRLKVVEENVSLKITETYSLVMSKDEDLCKHMLEEFNDDLMQHVSDGDNFHERHEEFTSIPWKKARYSYEYNGRVEYTDVEGALFDLNNDGISDYVVHDISMLSGMRADEIFMLDANEEKNSSDLVFKKINSSKNKIRIAGSTGYPLSAPLDGYTSDGWVLTPFKYKNTYYLFMRTVALGFMSDISVIAKYKSGKFEFRNMTGQMEDICYFKYNGEMHGLTPHER